MSIISYNDIQMALTKINSFEQAPVFTDDGKDYQYTRFTVDCSAVLNLNAPPAGGNARLASITNISNYIHVLRQELSLPRKPLKIFLGSDPAQFPQATLPAPELLLASSPPDAAGGPFPKSVNIKQVGGTNTVIINFVCETFLDECYCSETESVNNREVLTNRFETSFTYDTEGYGTRTIRGNLLVNGSRITNLSADDFRNLAVPRIPSGWKRESMEFMLSSDGLKLAYTITDREVYMVPMPGVTTISATYTENIENLATQLFCDVECTVRGPKNVSREWLLQKCLQVCYSRLIFDNRSVQEGNDLLQSSSITENMVENEFSARFRVRRTKLLANRMQATTAASVMNAPIDWETFEGDFAVLRGDEDFQYVGNYGVGLVGAAFAAWSNSCCPPEETEESVLVAEKPQEDEPSVSILVAQQVPAPTTTVAIVESEQWSAATAYLKHSGEHQNTPYTDVQQEETIVTEPYIFPMPVQAAPATAPAAPSVLGTEPPSPRPRSWFVPPTPHSVYPSPIMPGSVPGMGPFGAVQYQAPDLVQLTPPMQRRVVKFRAERGGLPPRVPVALERTEQGEVLLNKQICVETPELLADGQTFLYAIRGTYEYAICGVAYDETKMGLWAGKVAWVQETDSTQPNVQSIPETSFALDLADAERPNAFSATELGGA